MAAADPNRRERRDRPGTGGCAAEGDASLSAAASLIAEVDHMLIELEGARQLRHRPAPGNPFPLYVLSRRPPAH
jgi:hypothetical protein